MDINTRHNSIRHAVQCAAFAGILLILLVLASRMVERKDSENKNGSYFTEAAAGHIDGLLIGSSHVINGINPAQIYEETGYTVYNLAGHGSILPVSYWTLVNALDYCEPRYVYIDTYMIEKDYQYLDLNVEGDDHDTDSAVNQLHEVFDCFPETANKRAAIADLIADEETRREFSLDFIKYHSRWSALEVNDYTQILDRSDDALMGAQLRYEVSNEAYDFPLLAPDDMDETDSIGKQYLRKIIELCISRGITPVIIQVPFAADADYQRAANSAQRIADEYGIPFVNLQYAENLINYYSDLQSQTHLSAYGAYKVTRYFAEQVLPELAMIDHREDPAYKAWDHCVRQWHEEIVRVAASSNNLGQTLMMLQFDDLSSKVLVRSDSALFQNPVLAGAVRDLINNVADAEVIMIDPGSEYLFGEDHLEDDIQIEIYNKADGTLLSRQDFTAGDFMLK